MNWIAVSEKLPAPADTYSLFIICTDNGVGMARYDAGFKDVKIEGGIQYSSNNVTHWMPMPNKPESK